MSKRHEPSLQRAKSLIAAEKKHLSYIERWKRGLESGMRGKTSISAHIRKYLFVKYNNKCCICGWCAVNPSTGRIPLEVEHIDGDHTNNREENLKLLCLIAIR